MSGMTGKRERVSNYFGVVNGKIVKSLGKTAPENMQGVTERVNRNGETVFEIVSDWVGGRIVKAELVQPKEGKEEFGATAALTLESLQGEKCVVQMKFDSQYCRHFMYAVEAAELDRVIEIEPYKYFSKAKNRDVIGLQLLQDGAKLEWTYGTRDNMGGMPPLKEVTFKGKKTWDNTDQLEFLTGKYEEFCATIAALQTEASGADPLAGGEDDMVSDHEDMDDMPF